jgi:hypothetical protein
MYRASEQQVKKGDIIAIVLSYSTPIVIRLVGEAVQVLGESYVHGLLDGKAMRDLENGQCKVRRVPCYQPQKLTCVVLYSMPSCSSYAYSYDWVVTLIAKPLPSMVAWLFPVSHSAALKRPVSNLEPRAINWFFLIVSLMPGQ